MNLVYRSSGLITTQLSRAIQQHRSNMPNGLGRVEAFGADIHTVLNTMTPEDTERIIQLSQPPLCCRVSAVRQKAVSLQQSCRANKPIGVPPK